MNSRSGELEFTQKTFDDAVDQYRIWLALDRGQAPGELRASLLAINAQLSAAAEIMREIVDGGFDAGERSSIGSAWLRLGASIPPGLPRPLEEGSRIADVLRYWAKTAQAAATGVSNKHLNSAPLMAASFLWGLTFGGKQCSSTQGGAAGRALCRIAIAAGDYLSDAAASKALKRTNPNGKVLLRRLNPTA